MLSPHPADPILTTDNLMEVVKEVEHRWKDLGHNLGLRRDTTFVGGKFQTQLLDGVHGMADVVDEYVRHHPNPSWKKVATALQEMKLDKLADEVTTKYVRGMNVNHVTCLIQKLKLCTVYLMRGAEVWLTHMPGANIMVCMALKVDVYMPSGPACNWVYMCCV